MVKLELDNLKENKYVESIIHFGSSVKRKKYNDIDICIFTTKKLSLKQKLVLMRDLPEIYDINFYEDLPLNLKKEVLSEGKVVYTTNYLKILREIKVVGYDYPRYKSFLEDFHKKRAAEI